MTSREEALASLEQAHSFPGPFRFRVIGRPGAEFVADVLRVATCAAQVKMAPTPEIRPSSKGNYQSVSFVLHLERAEQVLDVYESLQKIKGVRYCL